MADRQVRIFSVLEDGTMVQIAPHGGEPLVLEAGETFALPSAMVQGPAPEERLLAMALPVGHSWGLLGESLRACRTPRALVSSQWPSQVETADVRYTVRPDDPRCDTVDVNPQVASDLTDALAALPSCW